MFRLVILLSISQLVLSITFLLKKYYIYSAMEHILLWSIFCYGAYSAMEHILLRSIFCYGAYSAMEHILLWSIFCYGAYSAMEHILLWSIFCYGVYSVMEGRRHQLCVHPNPPSYTCYYLAAGTMCKRLFFILLH